ncbi:MAG: AraC family transcriptional regulator [Spirochaetota bacterium]
MEGEKDLFSVGCNDAVILYVPYPVENEVPKNYGFHNICIVVEPSLLHPFIEEFDGIIPTAFFKLLEDRKDPYFQKCTATPAMRVILEQIQNCPYQGGLKRLYLEGKIFELLALRLGQLGFSHSPSSHKLVLTPVDVERIRHTELILLQHMQNPPSLTELARMAGVNVTKLKVGFKKVFGITVFGYLRRKRMETARTLLQEGRNQVSEIAYTTGYNSLSHFALAFKKKFGVNPHTYLRAGRYSIDSN